MAEPVCAVFGVGPGNGLACAAKFHENGQMVALCARNGEAMQKAAIPMHNARGYSCDVTDDAAVINTAAQIKEDLGPIGTVIFNAGNANWGSIDDLSPDDLDMGFDVNVKGLMRVVQAVLPDMRAHEAGNIIVIGAGAALRGRPGTLAFAAAKSAQRSMAQSLARQLGPQGIHVAYLILDGVVDLPNTKERMPEKPDSFFLSAAGVAEAAYALANQDRQAWTFELDVRPFGEHW